MKNILDNIIKTRKEKGLSYESMANELNLSTAAYRKIEVNETNLTIERLYKISEILQVSVAKLLDIEKEEYHQTTKDNSTVYSQKIENFYQENKETYEKLSEALQQNTAAQKQTIAAQQETIATQKAQIEALRGQITRGKYEI